MDGDTEDSVVTAQSNNQNLGNGVYNQLNHRTQSVHLRNNNSSGCTAHNPGTNLQSTSQPGYAIIYTFLHLTIFMPQM